MLSVSALIRTNTAFRTISRITRSFCQVESRVSFEKDVGSILLLRYILFLPHLGLVF